MNGTEDKRDCDECYHQDEITGACTNDNEECVGQSQFVKALGPDDMFKTLIMIIYNLGGSVEVSAKSIENVDEMKIEHTYDPKIKKFIFATEPQPPKPSLIKVPKKIRRRKLIVPGMN